MSRGYPALLLCAGLFLLSACREPAAPPPPSELEGLWIGSEEVTGLGPWTLEVEGDRYFIRGPGTSNWYRGQLRLHPAGRPGEANLSIDECDCDQSGQTIEVLYHLHRPRDGISDLQFASYEPGRGERPLEVDDEGALRLRLKRRITPPQPQDDEP